MGGFHLRGKHGADAYTHMVIQAIQKAQNLPVVIQKKPQSCATESSSKWATIVDQIISVTTHFTCSSNLLYTAIDLLAFYENRVIEDMKLVALAVIQISADWDGAPVSLRRTLNYMNIGGGSENDVQAIQTRISTELHIKGHQKWKTAWDYLQDFCRDEKAPFIRGCRFLLGGLKQQNHILSRPSDPQTH